MNSAIIYGGCGFIGSALAQYLNNKGVRVCVIDRPESINSVGYMKLQIMNIRFIWCDLCDIDRLFDLIGGEKYDVFYQFAWNGLDSDELLDYRTQINNIAYILDSIKIAKKCGCKKYIGAGTLNEGELLCKDGRYYQNDKHRYYRVAQFCVDVMGRGLAADYDIDFFWPRITNVYGPGEISNRLINRMIQNIIQKKDMSFSAGKQLYNFIYIDDAVNAFALIAEKGDSYDEYMIGSCKSLELREYLTIIVERIDPSYKLRLGEMDYSGLYPTKDFFNIYELNKLGFKENVTFEEGIDKTYHWIKDNLNENK